MEQYTVTILPGGRITIPVAIRKNLDLHPGDALVWWLEDRELHFRKAEPGEVASPEDQQSLDMRPSAGVDQTIAEEPT